MRRVQGHMCRTTNITMPFEVSRSQKAPREDNLNDAMLAAGGGALPQDSRVWTAKMVRPLTDKGVETRASFLRKTFTISSLGGAGTLTISALGLYRAFINGKRVGH